MSPELDSSHGAAEQVVADTIASAVSRARRRSGLEAVGWGVAAAAFSIPAGILVAVVIAWWRWRAATRPAIVRRLEQVQPDAHNLLVTADELARNALEAKEPVRARVFADAAVLARRVDLDQAFPLASLWRVALAAVAIWAIAAAAHAWRDGRLRGRADLAARTPAADGAAAGPRLHVSVSIQPPVYTGLKESTIVDPEQVQAIEGSVLVVSIDSSASGVRVEHDGATRRLTRGAGGRFTDRLQIARTGFLSVTADDGGRRTIPIVASPDALPVVRLTAPGRDLVYSGGNPRIVFGARATDDFGLRSLTLRYTRVTGSGENFTFQEGTIPLIVEPADARDWSGSASRSLAELGLAEGDMLVYHAEASDARRGDGSASSDAFIIEISKLGVAAGDAFTLPEEESKYALSQQMLIVKTERLHQRRTTLSAVDLTEQSLNLAVEQRMIRAEFVFMLGGEVNDEEVEAEQSVELQAGRLQNRGQRDLRSATVAMSQAEKLLTGSNTGEALVAERAAVAALQRAFSRDRYILRGMATRTQLDAARRLTGDLSTASGWRRTAPDAAISRRTALLQDLLSGIAELIQVRLPPSPVGFGATGKPDTAGNAAEAPVVSGFNRTRALVLAEEAIRIDPASASLRQAAGELQRAADEHDAAARSRALSAAASGVAAEARRADALAPLVSREIAPALTGAFADGWRRPR